MKIKLIATWLILLFCVTLFSQKSYGIFVGMNSVTFLENSKNYRFYSEKHFIGQTIGGRYVDSNSKRVKSLELIVKHRKNKIYTYNGGNGGSDNNRSNFDLTMIHLIGKVSLKEFHKSNFIYYLDGGVSLGFIANHKFENIFRRTNIFSSNSRTVISNDVNDFLNRFEVGAVFDFGIMHPMKPAIDFFYELQLGTAFVSNKLGYAKILGTAGLRFGVMKLIE